MRLQPYGGVQPTVVQLDIADAPGAWAAAGFDVRGDVCAAGTVTLRLEGPGRGRGIAGWAVRDLERAELGGLPTTTAAAAPVGGSGADHPNGVVAIDHLVAFTPDLDRTRAALEAAGLDFRRLREEPTPGGAPRQAFFRMGELILEVVQAPDGTRIASDPEGPARLWGISFAVRDLDATAAALGGLLGTIRPAVQAGRRIATLRREAGLGPAIAFMDAPETR